MDLALLSLELKLVKKSNPLQNVPKASETAVVNNTVNSLWSRSALYLNNIPVNQSTQFHHYKSFLRNLLNTTREEKASPLEVEGFWYQDGDELDTSDNGSFIMRKQLFQDENGEYTRNARLCGFIYHDLVYL